MRKEMNYWNNLDNVINEAIKYKTKKDFRKYCKSGYNSAIRNNYMTFLDENHFIKDNRIFNDKENKNHIIYVYEIERYKTCYVGRTMNLHNRDLSHRRGRKHSNGYVTFDCLYTFCFNKGIDVPIPIIKEEGLNARESLRQEDYWLRHYKDNGWDALNVAKTGEYSGSLGSYKRWTYERCKEFCKNYKYKSELRKANYQCYYVCHKNDWFKDFGIIDKKEHVNGYWNDKEKCLSAAKECSNKTDFILHFQGAYKSVIRNEWMNEINKIFAR